MAINLLKSSGILESATSWLDIREYFIWGWQSRVGHECEEQFHSFCNQAGTQRQFSENICSEDDLRSPYNFRITRLSARKSEQMKNF